MRHVFRLMMILPVFVMILLPDISISAKSQKTAPVIVNGAYSSSSLRNPVNDATDITQKSRHRTEGRSRLQLIFASIACNVKRYLKHKVECVQNQPILAEVRA